MLTHSEKEALLVEDQLVKQFQPRFNVVLRDDKRYLCLRLDARRIYPRLEVVRRFAKDDARYFGPYTSAQAVRETLRLVNRYFQLRTCSDQVMAGRNRPCLQYQIKRCPAPCVFDVSAQYATSVGDVTAFLQGRESELVETLKERMHAHARALNFEAAAQARDQLHAVERSLERQRIVTSDFANRDVVGIYREGPFVEVHVMRTREGRLIDAQRYSFDDLEIPTSEVLADFAVRYYTSGAEIPDEILFPRAMEWTLALAELLTERRNKGVRVTVPERGDKRRLVELACSNARQAFVDKQRERGAARSAIERLQRALHLSRPPVRIECVDISHHQGANIVASVVRFENGAPHKALYKHYKIRSTVGQDDFQSMYEVMSRRARRGIEESDLPDLFVIDGGKGQLNAARAALDDHGVDQVDIVGLAKSRLDTGGGLQSPTVPKSGHDEPSMARSPERVFVLGQKTPVVLRQNSAELFLLTRARDEAHRFAITFHRQQKRKSASRSVLDEIPGVGPKRRRSLLRAFGSVARLKEASEAELARVVGPKLAKTLHQHLSS